MLGSTIILRCSCNNAWQDSRYGLGLRVHNVGKKFNVCTCCGNQKGN